MMGHRMNRWLRCCVVMICLVTTSTTFAAFHLFQIEQLYSNADGTVQFIVLHESTNSNGENFWARGYAVSTVGYDLEKIRKYIREQESLEKSEGNF